MGSLNRSRKDLDSLRVTSSIVSFTFLFMLCILLEVLSQSEYGLTALIKVRPTKERHDTLLSARAGKTALSSLRAEVV